MAQQRRSIIYITDDTGPQECWICGSIGAFHYFDRVVAEYYCGDCAPGGIVAEKALSYVSGLRHPSTSEIELLTRYGR